MLWSRITSRIMLESSVHNGDSVSFIFFFILHRPSLNTGKKITHHSSDSLMIAIHDILMHPYKRSVLPAAPLLTKAL